MSTINLNDTVTVKVRDPDRARKHLIQEAQALGLTTPALIVADDGTVTCLLWELGQYFGPFMYNGTTFFKSTVMEHRPVK